MKGQLKAMVGAFAIVLAVAMPTSAGATLNWVCEVPGEGTVTFVSVPDARVTESKRRTRTRVKHSTVSSVRSAPSSRADHDRFSPSEKQASSFSWHINSASRSVGLTPDRSHPLPDHLRIERHLGRPHSIAPVFGNVTRGYGLGRVFKDRIRSKQPAHARATPAKDSPKVSHSPPRLSKTVSH